MQAYQALKDATVNINVSASSQRIPVLVGASGRHQVRVFNGGTATVWVTFGDGTVVADATKNVPVGAGGTEVFSVDPPQGAALNAAAIAAGATGIVYFTPGVGL